MIRKYIAQMVMLGVSILATQAQAAEITYKEATDGGRGVILLYGEIVEGDAAKVRRISAAHEASGIVLGSEGGNLAEALEIGRVVSIAGYGTAVLDGVTCASSCALIWLAGNRRLAGRTARIGFHAGYVLEDAKPVQSGVGNAMVGRYLTLLNLPASAVIFATSAKPDDMSWIDTSTPGAEGIPYSLLDDDEEDDSSSPTASVQAQRASGKGSSPKSTAYGKWMVIANDGVVTAFTIDKEESRKPGEVVGLYMKCFVDTKCRFILNFIAEKNATACEPGDTYDINYQVEGYAQKKIDTTCGIDGDELVLSNTPQFTRDILNETNVTFSMATDTGIRTIPFSLIGFDQAVEAMVQSGRVQDGMGMRPSHLGGE